jgi:hypothetical protein
MELSFRLVHFRMKFVELRTRRPTERTARKRRSATRTEVKLEDEVTKTRNTTSNTLYLRSALGLLTIFHLHTLVKFYFLR